MGWLNREPVHLTTYLVLIPLLISPVHLQRGSLIGINPDKALDIKSKIHLEFDFTSISATSTSYYVETQHRSLSTRPTGMTTATTSSRMPNRTEITASTEEFHPFLGWKWARTEAAAASDTSSSFSTPTQASAKLTVVSVTICSRVCDGPQFRLGTNSR